MQSYFLALDFPSTVKSRLASLCYGLPQVHWKEENNFHLILRHLGSLSAAELVEIKDRLAHLFFLPFSLTLQGVGHFHSKSDRGTIWIGIQPNASLMTLKREIDRLLKGLPIQPEKISFQPHIILGYYDRLNPQKLGDYLMAHADYYSVPIEITSCTLFCSRQTSKHTIDETLEHYLASKVETGED
ncbi:RNA 2',3'-cyclic phosphodiesterase [Candidatus Protochlamydia phocaeensis]|uniref:RNA 2',3'-cyclic phosphodiesterase n=1 Tax=Candidatus Protochlamydia phocaeensis TaxID=1414722 RepID=UPI000839746C|nr:RNA 2',3'-cyclic phosphodiesterase [Candidatus Protochlamydia phocaeensis]